jgi:hypothetical protein
MCLPAAIINSAVARRAWSFDGQLADPFRAVLDLPAALVELPDR